MTKQTFTILDDYDQERIDKVLTEINETSSRSQVQLWIKDGLVTVNGKQVKSNYKCQKNDLIEWTIPEIKPLQLKPENIPLHIVYEDEHLLVVNKEKGMVVHPSPGHETGTLVNALLYHCDDLSGINGVERPGIVHRIDKDTSGLLVVAKHDLVHERLSEMLANREIKRQYEAIVHGEIAHDRGTIDAPIARDPNDRQKMTVIDHGKQAITHFTVKERLNHFTHVYCELETGRTHQIRVHFQYINHPLVGDLKYGRRKTFDVQGQALHARSLSFVHPISHERLTFTEDAPDIFQQTLLKIKKSS